NILDVLEVKESSVLQELFSFAKEARGTLGGIFGKTVGVGLDLAKAAEGMSGGAAAGAAGPAAIVFAAAAAVNPLSETVAGALTSDGHFRAQLISSDVEQEIEMAGSSLQKFSDTLFLNNPILGAFGKSAGAAAGALSQLMRAIDGTIQRFA